MSVKEGQHPRRAVPVERVRGAPPERADWRHDTRALSHHGSLLAELRAPLENHDPLKAKRICGEVSRAVLRDFAPALLLLPRRRRERVQALVAYAATLFDFAAQRGTEGEPLTELNRWEFSLERALDGDPPGQPIFVRLAAEEKREAWRREGFDRLGEVARRRVMRRRPQTSGEADADADRLGEALLAPLVPATEAAALGPAAGAMARLRGLQDLGAALSTRRTRLPRELLADAWDPAGETSPEATRTELARAIAAECTAIRGRVTAAPSALPLLPPRDRPAAVFLLLAAQRLLIEVETKSVQITDEPPELGAWSRLTLLARARWRGLG